MASRLNRILRRCCWALRRRKALAGSIRSSRRSRSDRDFDGDDREVVVECLAEPTTTMTAIAEGRWPAIGVEEPAAYYGRKAKISTWKSKPTLDGREMKGWRAAYSVDK